MLSFNKNKAMLYFNIHMIFQLRGLGCHVKHITFSYNHNYVG